MNLYVRNVRFYIAVRTFLYIYDKQQLEKKLDTLGPDLIKDLPIMSQSDFNILLSKYDLKILADILLNQSFISGVGNMYRAEAMYKAKLSPLRLVKSLNLNDKKRLKKHLYMLDKIVILEIIKKKYMENQLQIN